MDIAIGSGNDENYMMYLQFLLIMLFEKVTQYSIHYVICDSSMRLVQNGEYIDVAMRQQVG